MHTVPILFPYPCYLLLQASFQSYLLQRSLAVAAYHFWHEFVCTCLRECLSFANFSGGSSTHTGLRNDNPGYEVLVGFENTSFLQF